jgi:Ca2+/Na+ antiporter
MNPIIDPSIFYWIEILSNINILFLALVLITMFLIGYLTFQYDRIDEDRDWESPEYNEHLKKEPQARYIEYINEFGRRDRKIEDPDYQTKYNIWKDHKQNLINQGQTRLSLYKQKQKRLNKRFTYLAFAFLFLFVIAKTFIPSESTMYKMLLAKNITPDNIETVQGKLTDLIDYIIEKVDALND